MKRSISKHLAPALLALSLAWAGSRLWAGVSDRIDSMRHALGWDSLSLKVQEKDSSGRPTLEGETKGGNRMSRVTVYYPSGKKLSQIFTVVEIATDKTVYLGKRDWIESGDLDSSYVRDDIFNAKGHPQRGWINERHFRRGHLVMEVRRNYAPETGDWTTQYRQTLSYYDDGDLQERITENSPTKKKWESWGEKAEGKTRKASVKNWNRTLNVWE